MIWKRFPRYWPFCEGNPQVTCRFPAKGPVICSFDFVSELGHFHYGRCSLEIFVCALSSSFRRRCYVKKYTYIVLQYSIASLKCYWETTTWWEPYPDSKVHGTNMGPTWVLSAPDGPHVGPMNLVIGVMQSDRCSMPVKTRLALRLRYTDSDWLWTTSHKAYMIRWQANSWPSHTIKSRPNLCLISADICFKEIACSSLGWLYVDCICSLVTATI